jgi:hypothetical protein
MKKIIYMTYVVIIMALINACSQQEPTTPKTAQKTEEHQAKEDKANKTFSDTRAIKPSSGRVINPEF